MIKKTNKKDGFEKEFRKEVNFNLRFAAIAINEDEDKFYKFMTEMQKMLQLKIDDPDKYYEKLSEYYKNREQYKEREKLKKERILKYKKWKKQQEVAISKEKYKPIKHELKNFSELKLNHNINFESLLIKYNKKIEEHNNQYSVTKIDEAINLICSLSMLEILNVDVNLGENFSCLIFKDNTASINKDSDGHYRYFTKNVSEGVKYYLDLIDIIQLVTNSTYHVAIRKICNIAKINVQELEWVMGQATRYENNIEIIDTYEHILPEYPILFKYIKKHLYLLKELNILAISNLATKSESVDGNSIFFASCRYIQRKLEKQGLKKKHSIINITINMFAALGLITKIPENSIPEELLNNSNHFKNKDNAQGFIVTFYLIKNMDKGLLEEAEKKVIALKEKKISPTMICIDTLAIVFGYEYASYIYSNNYYKTEFIKQVKIDKKETNETLDELGL